MTINNNKNVLIKKRIGLSMLQIACTYLIVDNFFCRFYFTSMVATVFGVVNNKTVSWNGRKK
jgi:hypothetical protein